MIVCSRNSGDAGVVPRRRRGGERTERLARRRRTVAGGAEQLIAQTLTRGRIISQHHEAHASPDNRRRRQCWRRRRVLHDAAEQPLKANRLPPARPEASVGDSAPATARSLHKKHSNMETYSIDAKLLLPEMRSHRHRVIWPPPRHDVDGKQRTAHDSGQLRRPLAAAPKFPRLLKATALLVGSSSVQRSTAAVRRANTADTATPVGTCPNRSRRHHSTAPRYSKIYRSKAHYCHFVDETHHNTRCQRRAGSPAMMNRQPAARSAGFR
jgi:hypothetical protein